MLKTLVFLFICRLLVRSQYDSTKLDEQGNLNDFVDGERIRQNLRDFTTDPHVAGTPANKRVAEKIADKWRSYGLSNVHFDSYRVLLSYPDYENPNHVRIFDQKKKKIFESVGVSPALIPDEQSAPNAGVQWVAYAANGTVKAPIVYCNYGRVEDLKKLEEEQIQLKDRIALIRYGKIFRGDKVREVQKRGAVGAILYSDPAECAQLGDHVYPNTDFMPPNGVQRGTLNRMNGDPLTPFFPARKDLYSKTTIEDAKASLQLPSIPVLPLSYSDSYQLLSRMCGSDVPTDWQGGLNITYKFGPCMQNEETVEIEVKSSLEIRTIQNVIGYIPGQVEPDRYVMLGNHFDAWIYGSIDPNSGTSILSETARALVEAAKSGVWMPRRTVVFVNWDAEEFGLVGSGEFVEGYAQQLSRRAVAYLNVDLISGNGSFAASTVPTLYDSIVEASKRVPNPVKSEMSKGRKTVYDTWIHHHPGDIKDRSEYPLMDVPGGGSDHERFLSYLGVPVVDFRYEREGAEASGYPLYHTLYETPFVNEHLFDWDELSVHTATARYWAQLTRLLAEPPVLPLNASMFAHRFLDTYARDLKTALAKAEKQIGSLEPASGQLSFLIRNVQAFVQSSESFHSNVISQFKDRREELNGRDELRLRAANDRLMEVDRCFVGPTAVPNSPLKRNILFSTSDLDGYSSSVMPGVYDQLSKLTATKATSSAQKRAIQQLTEQISALQFAVQCATTALTEFL
ncbi:Glutamate carboxypeptidase 2-like family protein [Aphelenchoides besseyi]|nr:Glutamate carboxypeptidase 2-like family protein [Aphelenchoides besseyi]